MASFLAKQVVGSQIKSLVGLDKKEEDQPELTDEVEDPAIAEARRKEREKLQEKHRQKEAKRAEMRRGIREKYSLTRKEEINSLDEPINTEPMNKDDIAVIDIAEIKEKERGPEKAFVDCCLRLCPKNNEDNN